jgi:hypothetical protein
MPQLVDFIAALSMPGVGLRRQGLALPADWRAAIDEATVA